jgi:hypothetical protein
VVTKCRETNFFETPFVVDSTCNIAAETNGTVDTSDYVVWRIGLGTTHMPSDYKVRRSHFGQLDDNGATLSSTESPSAGVSEPTTCGLIFHMAAGWCLSERRAAMRTSKLIDGWDEPAIIFTEKSITPNSSGMAESLLDGLSRESPLRLYLAPAHDDL